MGTHQRAADVGANRTNRVLFDVASEFRKKRLEQGLSQATVAAAARVSRSQVSRVELAKAPNVTLRDILAMACALGFDLSIRAFPNGSQIHDRAQQALLARFKSRLHPSAKCQREVPLPIPGDKRTWDLGVTLSDGQVRTEAETRPNDCQALLRKCVLRIRDDPGCGVVILLMSDTRHNRDLVRQNADSLATLFPGSARATLAALSAGVCPKENAILLL
jgi:transcriptional regulator with XRE-family HTH domain